MIKQTMQLHKEVAPFAKSDNKKSIFNQYGSTALLFWFLAYQSLSVSIWLTLKFAVIAVDSSSERLSFSMTVHGSFFKSRKQMTLLAQLQILHYFRMRSGNVSMRFINASSSNLDAGIMTFDYDN